MCRAVYEPPPHQNGSRTARKWFHALFRLGTLFKSFEYDMSSSNLHTWVCLPIAIPVSRICATDGPPYRPFDVGCLRNDYSRRIGYRWAIRSFGNYSTPSARRKRTHKVQMYLATLVSPARAWGMLIFTHHRSFDHRKALCNRHGFKTQSHEHLDFMNGSSVSWWKEACTV